MSAISFCLLIFDMRLDHWFLLVPLSMKASLLDEPRLLLLFLEEEDEKSLGPWLNYYCLIIPSNCDGFGILRSMLFQAGPSAHIIMSNNCELIKIKNKWLP